MKVSYLKFRNENQNIYSDSLIDESVVEFLKFQFEKDF